MNFLFVIRAYVYLVAHSNFGLFRKICGHVVDNNTVPNQSLLVKMYNKLEIAHYALTLIK